MDSPKTQRNISGGATISTLTDRGFGFISRATDKGFGFISRRDEEKDLFFHAKELMGVTYEELREGDQVEFDIIDNPKGLAAASVRRRIHADDDLDDEPDADDELEAQPDADGGLQKSTAFGRAVQQFARAMAEEIAQNPLALEELEWRDLERVIAEAFSGLGLDVELTPGSGDGGKDVVVSFMEASVRKTYFVEIKHWRFGKVGEKLVSEFVHVVARAKVSGGVMLATSGFTRDTIEWVTEIERRLIGFGTRTKLVSLCRDYAKAKKGIWRPPEQLERVIFDDMD